MYSGLLVIILQRKNSQRCNKSNIRLSFLRYILLMSILAFVEEIEQMMKKEGFDMETVLTRRSGPELLSILRFQRTQA